MVIPVLIFTVFINSTLPPGKLFFPASHSLQVEKLPKLPLPLGTSTIALTYICKSTGQKNFEKLFSFATNKVKMQKRSEWLSSTQNTNVQQVPQPLFQIQRAPCVVVPSLSKNVSTSESELTNMVNEHSADNLSTSIRALVFL